jgi:hypothetical protein
VTISPIAHDDFRMETVLAWNRLNRSRVLAEFVAAADALS